MTNKQLIQQQMDLRDTMTQDQWNAYCQTMLLKLMIEEKDTFIRLASK